VAAPADKTGVPNASESGFLVCAIMHPLAHSNAPYVSVESRHRRYLSFTDVRKGRWQCVQNKGAALREGC
jgi:hypothetical protein